jgi:hypothetical protein
MAGANGSRECAPDDKLRDTHQLEFEKMMGFANGPTDPTMLLQEVRGLLGGYDKEGRSILSLSLF